MALRVYKLCINFRFSLPKISAQLSETVLTHWDTEGNQDNRDDAEDPEHLAAAGFGRPGVDEGREGVEEEVLQHHLKHKDFRRLSGERVAGWRNRPC